MPSVVIMRQIVLDLATAFPEIRPWEEIYLTPRVLTLPSASPFELQVCEAGVAYIDHEGSVRREQFMIHVGILRKFALDSGKRHSRALSDLSESLFAQKEKIIDKLDGNFLTGDLLVRPLTITSESEVKEKNGILYKILAFTGGINAKWY